MKLKMFHSLGTGKQTLDKRNPQRQGRKPAPTLLHGRRHDSDVSGFESKTFKAARRQQCVESLDQNRHCHLATKYVI